MKIYPPVYVTIGTLRWKRVFAGAWLRAGGQQQGAIRKFWKKNYLPLQIKSCKFSKASNWRKEHLFGWREACAWAESWVKQSKFRRNPATYLGALWVAWCRLVHTCKRHATASPAATVTRVVVNSWITISTTHMNSFMYILISKGKLCNYESSRRSMKEWGICYSLTMFLNLMHPQALHKRN